MPLVPDNLTFFGLPRHLADAPDGAGTILLGIPSSLGAPAEACRNGPYFLRRLSQRHVWQSERPDIVDLRARAMVFADVRDAGDLAPADDWTMLERHLQALDARLPRGARVIAVGGDHSITLPLVARCARGPHPVTLVVFDHHLDYQYWSRDTDPPFNTNVMTHVAGVLGPGRIVHVGVDPIQTVDHRLRHWYLDQLARAGTQIALFSPEIDDDAAILRAVGTGQDIYLSVDVDVLAAGEMRSTGYPSEAGLTLARTIALIRRIAAANTVVGCDLVEFAAAADDRRRETLDDAARAATLLLELILATIGTEAGIDA